MSDEQINIRVAKILGLPIASDGITHCLTPCDMGGKCNQDGPLLKKVPNYVADLNACHEFEKTLGDIDNWMLYDKALAEITEGFTFHATARQRCEAFLRVHGQWEEEV